MGLLETDQPQGRVGTVLKFRHPRQYGTVVQHIGTQHDHFGGFAADPLASLLACGTHTQLVQGLGDPHPGFQQQLVAQGLARRADQDAPGLQQLTDGVMQGLELLR